MDKETLQNIYYNLLRHKIPDRQSIFTILMQGIRIHENLDNVINISLNTQSNQQLYIIGDLHGQFEDFIQILHIIDAHSDTSIPKQLLFLGDIIDRGLQSIETLLSILVIQQLWPDRIFIVRGNHETESISRLYGFYDECCRKNLQACYSIFLQLFQTIPIAVIITQQDVLKDDSQNSEQKQHFPEYFYEKLYTDKQVESCFHSGAKQTTDIVYNQLQNQPKKITFTQQNFRQVNFRFQKNDNQTENEVIKRIFCCHGGLSQYLQNLDELDLQIRALNDFLDEKEQKIIADILWSDPSEGCEYYAQSQRNKGHIFGAKAVNDFITKNDIQLIIRAHQWCATGFKLELNDRVITVWSAANYESRCGNTGTFLLLEKGRVYHNQFKKVFQEGEKQPAVQIDYFL